VGRSSRRCKQLINQRLQRLRRVGAVVDVRMWHAVFVNEVFASEIPLHHESPNIARGRWGRSVIEWKRLGESRAENISRQDEAHPRNAHTLGIPDCCEIGKLCSHCHTTSFLEQQSCMAHRQSEAGSSSSGGITSAWQARPNKKFTKYTCKRMCANTPHLGAGSAARGRTPRAPCWLDVALGKQWVRERAIPIPSSIQTHTHTAHTQKANPSEGRAVAGAPRRTHAQRASYGPLTSCSTQDHTCALHHRCAVV